MKHTKKCLAFILAMGICSLSSAENYYEKYNSQPIKIEERTKNSLGNSAVSFSKELKDARKWQVCNVEMNGWYHKSVTKKPSQYLSLSINGKEVFNGDIENKETRVVNLNMTSPADIKVTGMVKNANGATNGGVTVSLVCNDGLITNVAYGKPVMKSEPCDGGEKADKTGMLQSYTPQGAVFTVDSVPYNYKAQYSHERTTTNTYSDTQENANELTVSISAQVQMGVKGEAASAQAGGSVSRTNKSSWKHVISQVNGVSEKETKSFGIDKTITEPGTYQLLSYEIPLVLEFPVTVTVDGKAGKNTFKTTKIQRGEQICESFKKIK